MKIITYSLVNEKNKNSKEFYEILDNVSNETSKLLIDSDVKNINDYIDYIRFNDIEKIRDFDEYLVEYLTIGVLWNLYIRNAYKFNKKFSYFFEKLFFFRRKYKKLKKIIDIFRGIFSYKILKRQSNRSNCEIEINLSQFDSLLKWLKSASEFNQEVKRLSIWYDFLKNNESEDRVGIISDSIKFALKFEKLSAGKFCSYTKNVKKFVKKSTKIYRYKEDYFFCQKSEVEYHLNMVGAELINRAHREKFLKTKKKILLLPSCMRVKNSSECNAIKDDLNFICVGCSKECNINKYRFIGEETGFEICIIPHSSDFSKWLKKWENSTEVGVLAATCVLNLLTGGYEMINLNIPAQCIFLDYCGCKNHWHKIGISTDIDSVILMKRLGN